MHARLDERGGFGRDKPKCINVRSVNLMQLTVEGGDAARKTFRTEGASKEPFQLFWNSRNWRSLFMQLVNLYSSAFAGWRSGVLPLQGLGGKLRPRGTRGESMCSF